MTSFVRREAIFSSLGGVFSDFLVNWCRITIRRPKFLPKITVDDPAWRDAPTWLIDTGDVTTLGDVKSLRLGHQWLEKFREAAGGPGHRWMYGNHDAWPGDFPLFASLGSIDEHRNVLRSRWYKDRLPEDPLSVDIPGRIDGAQIQLWTLNSVVHARDYNTLALGRIQEDRFWEDPSGSRDPGNAVPELARKIERRSGAARDFRILASHHPVHYPEKPAAIMFMTNANEVARDLLRPGNSMHSPLAHLVLSGHTHELFPAVGHLPKTGSMCNHDPLSPNQCQLIAGSLSQRRAPATGYPQQCQLLRFYYSEAAPDEVIMERLIAARANGLGDYKFVQTSPGNYSEEIVFTFAA